MVPPKVLFPFCSQYISDGPLLLCKKINKKSISNKMQGPSNVASAH